MLSMIILAILAICLYLWLKHITGLNFQRLRKKQQDALVEYERLFSENARLKADNSVLEEEAENIIALYDLTKEVCKRLEEDEVISDFLKNINRYLKVDDCVFTKDKAGLDKYKGYTVVSLDIDKGATGYLAVKGVNDEALKKLHILSHQFLLGLKRAHLYHKVQELAITDSLTGVFSRRYLISRLNEELERSHKFKYNFSFLMIDIDHFKEKNDRYGHLVGDAILREVSKSIKDNIRQIDLVGRYGGEEFSVILAETERNGARFAAERIRISVVNNIIKVYDEKLQVTVSIGGAVYPDDASDADAIIDRADAALYKAKEMGRNRVCVR